MVAVQGRMGVVVYGGPSMQGMMGVPGVRHGGGEDGVHGGG